MQHNLGPNYGLEGARPPGACPGGRCGRGVRSTPRPKSKPKPLGSRLPLKVANDAKAAAKRARDIATDAVSDVRDQVGAVHDALIGTAQGAVPLPPHSHPHPCTCK